MLPDITFLSSTSTSTSTSTSQPFLSEFTLYLDSTDPCPASKTTPSATSSSISSAASSYFAVSSSFSSSSSSPCCCCCCCCCSPGCFPCCNDIISVSRSASTRHIRSYILFPTEGAIAVVIVHPEQRQHRFPTFSSNLLLLTNRHLWALHLAL